MLPASFSFKKSYAQRLKEYKHLYRSQELCSNLCKVWGFDLECVINKMNWMALWQLSQEACIEYKALFPTTVVVRVTEIIFDELTALVVVEGVQDDLSFPEVVNVPVFELFPVRVSGPPTELCYLRDIADWLDRCRFFCLYLWYYWDGSNSTELLCEWAEKHLENRLRLQYDIRDGTLDKSAASYIQCLITEAVQVADAVANSDVSEANNEEKVVVLKNVMRQKKIKSELLLFEVPGVRDAMVLYIHEKLGIPADKKIVTVIMPNFVQIGDVDPLFERIRLMVDSDASLRVFSDAKLALPSIPHSGTVLIAPGIHYVENLGGVSNGGAVKGIGAGPEETILVPMSMEPKQFMFLSCFNSVIFENISVKRSEGVLVSAFEGVVRFESCHFIGEPDSLTTGIVVQSGCRVEIVQCVFSNLNTAIIAKNNSALRVTSTVIRNCGEGLKFMDGVSVTLSESTIENCSVTGLALQSALRREDVSGSLTILSDCITLNNTKFIGNKVDAMVESLPEGIV